MTLSQNLSKNHKSTSSIYDSKPDLEQVPSTFEKQGVNLLRELRRLFFGRDFDESLASDLIRVLAETADSTFRITKLCYYYFDHESQPEKLVSMVGSGFTEGIARKITEGRFVRFRNNSTSKTADPAFLSLDDRIPTHVKINSNTRVSKSVNKQWKLNNVSIEPKESDFPSRIGQYIDIPILFGGQPLGKLVCDFPQSNSLRVDIYAFWKLLFIAAPFFELCSKQKLLALRTEIQKLRANLDETKTLDEFYQKCVTELPKNICNCQNASIFQLERDSNGEERLILKATSHSTAKHLVNDRPYSIDYNSLTGFCAKEKRTIRVHGLSRKSKAFKEQLERIHPSLTWSDRITDSTNHSTFLAVPILTAQKECIGVIRFTEKSTHPNKGEFFHETDEEVMSHIAKTILAPNILRLKNSEFSECLKEYIESIHLLTISGALLKTLNFEKEVCNTVFDLIKGDKKYKKLCILNLLTSGNEFEVREIFGDMELSIPVGGRYNSKNYMTGFTLRAQAPIHFIDLEKAQVLNRYIPAAESAKSAISAPISFCGQNFGVIVLLSDGRDLTGIQKDILGVVAKLCSEHYARNEFRLDSLAAHGIRHDIGTNLGILRLRLLDAIDAVEKRKGRRKLHFLLGEVIGKLDFTEILLDVYLHPTRYQSALESNKIRANVNVESEVVNLALNAARSAENYSDEVPIKILGKWNGLADIQIQPIVTILFNLLKNGMRHGSAGSVEIHISKNSRELVIGVINVGGSGIEPEIRELLKARELSGWLIKHWRISDHRKPVGLLLSKGLAAMYRLEDGRRAELVYDSQVGKHIFSLKIPLKKTTNKKT